MVRYTRDAILANVEPLCTSASTYTGCPDREHCIIATRPDRTVPGNRDDLRAIARLVVRLCGWTERRGVPRQEKMTWTCSLKICPGADCAVCPRAPPAQGRRPEPRALCWQAASARLALRSGHAGMRQAQGHDAAESVLDPWGGAHERRSTRPGPPRCSSGTRTWLLLTSNLSDIGRPGDAAVALQRRGSGARYGRWAAVCCQRLQESAPEETANNVLGPAGSR